MMRTLAALLVTCCTSPQIPAQEQTVPGMTGLVDELIGMQKLHRVPALGLALFRNGEPVLIGAYGTADKDTPLRWGSISKSFTALAALNLAQERQLPLTTPVAALLQQQYFHNPWSRTDPVRLIHLLELTAGFSDLSRAEFDDNEPLPLSAALTRGAANRDLRWPPGWQHSYTNVAPGITAAVIEALSEQTFEQYMTDAVLQPLHMPAASFEPVPGLPGGFRADGTTPIPYWHMTFRAFGALNASIAEMGNFVSMLLNEGRLRGRQVFAPEVIARMHTPGSSLGARAGLALTYAAGLYPWIRDGHVIWGHGGDADGYRSRYGLQFEAGRGYLLVINTDNPGLLRRMHRRIEGWMLSDLQSAAPPAVSRDSDLQRYAGEYYPSSARFGLNGWLAGESPGIRIRATDQYLEVLADNRNTRLYPLGDGRFRRREDPGTTVVFVDTGALLLMQGELGNHVNLSRTPCPAFLRLCPRE